MYSELYVAWKGEIENPALQPLPADFFARVSGYIQQIKTETQAPDRNAVKAALMAQERRNVTRMVKELLRTRYKKLLKTVKGGQKLLPDILTNEETEFFTGLLPFAEAYSTFARGLLQGQTPKPMAAPPEAKPRPAEAPLHKRVTVRFVKAIPAIVGSDMQTYGPFQPEDVASVPEQNAKILVKQGLAQNVEVS
jgi:DNA replication factor GINS